MKIIKLKAENIKKLVAIEIAPTGSVVKITGKVRLRPAGAVNKNMASGGIEVLGYELEVLNESETPPFPLNEYSDVGEETRLRYRFLDLRRPEMAEKLPAWVRLGTR